MHVIIFLDNYLTLHYSYCGKFSFFEEAFEGKNLELTHRLHSCNQPYHHNFFHFLQQRNGYFILADLIQTNQYLFLYFLQVIGNQNQVHIYYGPFAPVIR